jgi:hypothetical protein
MAQSTLHATDKRFSHHHKTERNQHQKIIHLVMPQILVPPPKLRPWLHSPQLHSPPHQGCAHIPAATIYRTPLQEYDTNISSVEATVHLEFEEALCN